MLTLFSVPKPFKGEIGKIQRRAIESWKKLGCEILLLKEDELEKNEFGTPLVSSMLEMAQKEAKGNIVSYISTDIMLLPDFYFWVEIVADLFPQFLMVGRRHDIQKDGTIKIHGKSALDYWAFPKNIEWNMPPFGICCTSFDNWLLWKAKNMGIPTIDASPVITIYHQYHKRRDYSHSLVKREIKRNQKLARGHLATLRDTEYILTKQRLKKRPFTFYNLVKPLLPLWRKIRQF